MHTCICYWKPLTIVFSINVVLLLTTDDSKSIAIQNVLVKHLCDMSSIMFIKQTLIGTVLENDLFNRTV